MSRSGAVRIETLLSALVAVLLIVGGYAWNRGNLPTPSAPKANHRSEPSVTMSRANSASAPVTAPKPSHPLAGPLFDGKSLAGWRVADKINFDMHGKVTVEEGAIRMAPGQPATGIAWIGNNPIGNDSIGDKPVGGESKRSTGDGKASDRDAKKTSTADFPRMNYELRLEAMRTEGNDFFCGLTFPIGEEYCTLIIGGWGGGVVGLSNVDNYSAVENETTDYRDFKDNTWYRIRLRVTPAKVEAWIDDESAIDLETKNKKFSIWWEQEPMRPFGIATWYTGAAIRNVVLARVAADEKDRGP